MKPNRVTVDGQPRLSYVRLSLATSLESSTLHTRPQPLWDLRLHLKLLMPPSRLALLAWTMKSFTKVSRKYSSPTPSGWRLNFSARHCQDHAHYFLSTTAAPRHCAWPVQAIRVPYWDDDLILESGRPLPCRRIRQAATPMRPLVCERPTQAKNESCTMAEY